LIDFGIASSQSSSTFYIRHDELEDLTITASAGGGSGLADATSDVSITGACSGITNIGEVCPEGGIYAGEHTMDGTDYRYMTTGSSCNDSATPTCDENADPGSRAGDGLAKMYGSWGVVHNAGSRTDGAANTAAILAAQSNAAAAKFCDDMTYAGYTDWYLPAFDELFDVIFLNRTAIGGISWMHYWSSTENTGNTTRALNLTVPDGHEQNTWFKDNSSFLIRCLRRDLAI